jgi:hypothetical protein
MSDERDNRVNWSGPITPIGWALAGITIGALVTGIVAFCLSSI